MIVAMLTRQEQNIIKSNVESHMMNFNQSDGIILE